ncbi:NUDIX hydrolase [Ktedonosporobacter rubrisoli]|uniref:NUDIX hydrolase n=1 Tax=Ktedonosporobacter rubrisoli TaxID=2509675 RepID=UPI0013EE4FB9|nr:NUDIX domain-containing protein [Ktedonosporobacter rubrisoli]
MLYRAFKKLVGVCFNILNFLLAGNLPPFACVGVIIEDQGRFLVVQLPEGGYAFPGGFMRWREHPTQTAERECREETGLHIRTHDVIGYYSITSPQLDRMSTLNIIYRGEVISGELHSSIEGRPCWLPEEGLQGKLTTLHRTILADYHEYRAQEQRRQMSIKPV